MLSEISQTEKDKHHRLSLIWGIFKKKITKVREATDWWLAGVWVVGEWVKGSEEIKIKNK